MPEEVEVEVLPDIIPNLIQSAPVANVVQAQKDYHDLCDQLLDDSDYQVIGNKKFRKKSGWRKLAVAFNVSTELLKEDVERGPKGQIYRVQCTVRATAPNGRFQDGIGACDVTEKCCDSATCRLKEVWEDSGKPTGHVHCDGNCSGRKHFSNPSHDIPTTAMTRATNRAQADLFGMGEVSAEEMVVSVESAHETPSEARRGPDGVAMAHQSQIDRITALIGQQSLYTDWDQTMIGVFGHPVKKTALIFSDARKVISTLQSPQK